MSNRFMLTAAGTASVAVASIASAELIDFTVVNDRYIGEATWQIINSSGSTVASMYISGSSVFLPDGATFTPLAGYSSSPSFVTSYLTEFSLDLAPGEYTVAMQDSWGDGWSYWFPTGGMTVSGALASGSSVSFAFSSGSSAGGTFTVVPAPGALALLGLAGVAGRRRRS